MAFHCFITHSFLCERDPIALGRMWIFWERKRPLLGLKERIPFNFKETLEKGVILAAISDSKI